MNISTPENFESLWDGIVYQYSNDDAEDIIVQIYNARSNSLIGVKKFYSATSFKLNIAPLVFETMMPSPQVFATSYLEYPYDRSFPSIYMKFISASTGSIIATTETKTFTYSKSGVELPSLITTMPTSRVLNLHETDAFCFVYTSGATAKHHIYATKSDADGGSLEETLYCSESGQAGILYISASDFLGCSTASITFEVDQTQVGVINYTFSSETPTGYRVAWLSSRGSIEHYTFPIVSEQSYTNQGSTIKSLRSAYGTKAEIEALSEIISSPRVWHFEGEEYSLIKVLSSEQPIIDQAALSIITIKVEENGEG